MKMLASLFLALFFYLPISAHAESCADVYPSFKPTSIRGVVEAFRDEDITKFVLELNKSGVKPGMVSDSKAVCLELLHYIVGIPSIFQLPDFKYTSKHKAMFDLLVSMGFDVNARAKARPNEFGDKFEYPVVSQVYGGKDPSMLKWLVEAGANLYVTFPTHYGVWETPAAVIVKWEAKRFPFELPMTKYLLEELDYPPTEGGLCMAFDSKNTEDLYGAYDYTQIMEFDRYLTSHGYNFYACDQYSIPVPVGPEFNWFAN